MHCVSNRSRKLCVGVVVLSISAWGVAGLPLHVKSPGSPGMTVIDNGTVYFRPWLEPDRLWSMRPDGSGKYPLPAGVSGEPSRFLHGGHRWFLTVREIEGDVRVGRASRRELVAVREDGRTVRLALPENLDPACSTPRWPVHGRDGLVTWIARRMADDGTVVEGGIYAAKTRFDSKGNLVGLAEPAYAPLASRPIIPSGRSSNWSGAAGVPDIESHDWSPDGKCIVFEAAAGKMGLLDVTTGAVRRLGEVVGYNPAWSPDGERIAFQVGPPFGGIAVIRPDGTGFQSILRPTEEGQAFVVASPIWSASGEYLACQHVGGLPSPVNSPCPVDVLVLDRAGLGRRNLTTDIASSMTPVAWRNDEEADKTSESLAVAAADGVSPLAPARQ